MIPKVATTITDKHKSQSCVQITKEQFDQYPNIVKIIWGSDAEINPSWRNRQVFMIPDTHPAYQVLMLMFPNNIIIMPIICDSAWSTDRIWARKGNSIT